jgi:hypothetical protein
VTGLAIAGRALGAGFFDAYPALAIDHGAATVGLACAIPVIAALPFATPPRRRRR